MTNPKRNAPYDDPDLLRELHHDKRLYVYEIADRFGVERSTIRRALQRYDITTRQKGADPLRQHGFTGDDQ